MKHSENIRDIYIKNEKIMDKGLYKGTAYGIILAIGIYYIPELLYIFIIFVMIHLTYNQSRFTATNNFLLFLNNEIETLSTKYTTNTDSQSEKKQTEKVTLNALQKTGIILNAKADNINLSEKEITIILEVENILDWEQELRKKLAPYLNMALSS